MVWTAEQMIASYGNAMPESYWAQDQRDLERMSWAAHDTLNRHIAASGERLTDVRLEHDRDSYWFVVEWCGASAIFGDLGDADEWIERMVASAHDSETGEQS